MFNEQSVVIVSVYIQVQSLLAPPQYTFYYVQNVNKSLNTQAPVHVEYGNKGNRLQICVHVIDRITVATENKK